MEELGSKEGQGASKVEAPQQQALGLALAEMGSLPGWLVAQGAAGEQRSQGCWIGEGLPAIPKKLLEKLHRWEFADLAELRPLRANEMLNQNQTPNVSSSYQGWR